jgi:PadR family transcriptional regulator PadR
MVRDDLMDFWGGIVRLHILHHAIRQPIYSVEMITESGRFRCHLSPGTLYPVLRDLADAGYPNGEKRVVDGTRRKNYRATK